MPRTRLPIIALLLTILCPVAVAAYPIPAQPLWPLTAKAELIVVATVVEVEHLTGEDDDWNSAVARLRVLRTLKGVEKASLEVPYPAGLLCPAPPYYDEGQTVVAFLSKVKGRWSTVSLSYGTLYAEGRELAELEGMVRAAVEIQQTTTEPGQLAAQKLAWLVEAAALPGTRWHGLYELAPASDRLHSAFDHSGRTDGLRIEPRHQALLAAAFVAAPKVDKTMPMMLQLLGRIEDEAVDHLAISTLEALLALEAPPWWTQDLLWAVLRRAGDEQGDKRLAKLGVDPWELTFEQLRQVWVEAKTELGLPDLPPAKLDFGDHLPVGGDTPS